MKKYLRKITALLPKEIAIHLRSFLFLFFVILAGVLLQVLVTLNGKYLEYRKNYAQKVGEYEFWSSVVKQYPNIPDVLFNASISAYNAGKRNESGEYIKKALRIDPLFKKAELFQKEING